MSLWPSIVNSQEYAIDGKLDYIRRNKALKTSTDIYALIVDDATIVTTSGTDVDITLDILEKTTLGFFGPSISVPNKTELYS